MESADRLETLYDTTLQPRLAALETLRLSAKSYIVKSGTLIGIPAALLVFRGLIDFMLPDAWAAALPVVAVIGIVIGVVIAGVKYLIPGLTAYTNYKAKFKHDIVAEIFKIVCPSAEYSPHQGIAAPVFDAAGIFSTNGTYVSDDRVRGRIGRTPFEAGESKRSFSSGTGKDEKTYVVFHGLFFHFDFNKTLRGVTIVEPTQAPSYQIGKRSGLSVVAFENPDFAKAFKVYASNDVEARYVLTPAMMERLLTVQAEAERPVFLAFRDTGAYLGVHYDQELFEPSIASTTSKAAILEMASHFGLAEAIVNELDLNTRIWTKDVDESLLDRPDEQQHGLMELAAAQSGTLTEKELWSAAKAAAGEDYANEAGVDIPKPAHTGIRIDRESGQATVRYRWSLSFYLFVLVTFASVAVAFSALRQLASTQLAFVGSLLGRLPTHPAIDSFVGSHGVIWLPVALGVGALFTTGWILRVRRVVVMPSEVLVYRGVSPSPHHYPRPEYNSIFRMKNSVHVSKGEGVTLFNPTASPNISEAEAGWVASEVRKALQSIAPQP